MRLFGACPGLSKPAHLPKTQVRKGPRILRGPGLAWQVGPRLARIGPAAPLPPCDLRLRRQAPGG